MQTDTKNNENFGKPIIEVKNISKKYNITHMKGGYVALRDVMANIFKNPFGFVKDKAKETIGFKKKEEFSALHDISFTIEEGDTVGIIGANGAGKSTLLKILSQITPPTEGEIILRGRVGSLLEVGTGFHPELTGRENIFLNGAILGMRKKEIEERFDKIVEFAGIDKFLDTPVKHYSSGMYVRLAFAVAAYMEPDILLVDEVLAVGDAEFQKKCLGKMDEITKEKNRTILFVSHNMTAIQTLCKKTIVLKDGGIAMIGDTKEAVEFYLNQREEGTQFIDLEKSHKRLGTGKIRLSNFYILDENKQKTQVITAGSSCTFVFEYKCKNPEEVKKIDIGFSIGKDLKLLTIIYSSYTGQEITEIKREGKILFKVDKIPFVPGNYNIGFRALVNGLEADWPKDIIGSFRVQPSPKYLDNNFKINESSLMILEGEWS